MLKDFRLDMTVGVYTDSTAAIGITERRGGGKVRHLDVNLLWVQQKRADGLVNFEKVRGNENFADLMTKALDAAKIICHLGLIGCEFRDGDVKQHAARPK